MSARRIAFVIGTALVVIVLGFLGYQYYQKDRLRIAYHTAQADRGDIVAYVSTTGTLNPLTMVEVGSQVSGIVTDVSVDFNSRVKKGDVLARIDPAPARAQVRQAEAQVKKALEDVKATQKIVQENAELYEKRLISREEYDEASARYTSAVAVLEQAQAVLELARVSLRTTTIRAPMDGVVVSRNLNVGQTVTASQQALFVIAADLAHMQLDAHISESDIGKIDVGQPAVFTVDAYPEQQFRGRVWQLRQVPVVTQNVVTYTVVILVDNKDLKLKPGMTAEVSILVASRHNVLRVPREALRFLPPSAASVVADQVPSGVPVVWKLRDDTRLQPVPITTGVSDERFTEVLGGNLAAGDEVVIEAMVQGEADTEPFGPSVLPQPKRF